MVRAIVPVDGLLQLFLTLIYSFGFLLCAGLFFPFRVLYGSQSRFHGFRLPDRIFKSEPKLDPEPRMAIVVSVSRNHAWVSKLFTVINSASMIPVTVICSLVMIEFANVMAEFMMPSS